MKAEKHIKIGERGFATVDIKEAEDKIVVNIDTRSKLPKGSVVFENFYGFCRITVVRPGRKPVTEWIEV